MLRWWYRVEQMKAITTIANDVVVAGEIDNATLALISDNDSSRTGSWISTFTGGRWYPLDPRVEEVRIEDIAHSLSMLCRYNGHSKYFYSVAEHCLLLSYAVPEPYKLEAHVHDGVEAYVSDLPRPFKYSDSMALFREVEAKNAEVVYEFMGLTYPESDVVKEYDKRIVRNEGEVLLPHCDWFNSLERIPDIEIMCYSPKKVEQLYLDRYYELQKNI